MRRKAVVQGCDQAVFPFSVASSSFSTDQALDGGNGSPVRTDENTTHLFLSLQQNERVRVLQRDSAPCSKNSKRSLNPTLGQWCIAQREDGAVGLVPLAILHRVPGVAFTLTSEQQRRGFSTSTHSDPADMNGVRSYGGATPTKLEKGNHDAVASSSVSRPAATDPQLTENGSPLQDGADDVDDLLELQRRRQASLQDRLAALQTPPGSVEHLGNQNSNTPIALSNHSKRRQLDHQLQRDNPKSAVGDAERDLIVKEAAQVEAEVEWLSTDVLTQLQAARAEADRVLQVEEERIEDFVGATREETGNGHACKQPTSAAAATEVERNRLEVTRQLTIMQRLKTWLERRAAQHNCNSDDEDVEELDAALDADMLNGTSQKTELFAERDANCVGTNPTHKQKASSTRMLDSSDTYMIAELRRLVGAEIETVASYRTQQQSLQHQLNELDQLSVELHQEEEALSTSESALHSVGGATNSTADDASAQLWPPTLPGLTSEEAAALQQSVFTYDKYTRKLDLLTHHRTPSTDVNAAVNSSLEVSDGNTSVSGRIATASTDRSFFSSLQATPEKTSSRGVSTAATDNSGATPQRRSAHVVQHLQQVLTKGDNELLQMRSKMKALQEFCSTYTNAADEIETQLQRGQLLLEQKRRQLAQLQ